VSDWGRLRGLLALQVVLGVLVLVGVVPGLAPPGCIEVELSTSIEVGKVRMLGDIADRYNDERHFVDGRCVEMSVHGTTSGLAMQALRDGWDPGDVGAPEPQAWTPTSSMWFDRLELADRGDVLVDEGEQIAESATVVAMPETMAQALGWPDQEITWETIRELSEGGWATRGHPEWGAFTFGKDDPDVSTSALGATVATFLAAARIEAGREPGTLLEDDVDAPAVRGFVQDIEAGVHNYEEDILDTLRNLGRYDADGNSLDYISAMVLQEQLVHEYNEGAYMPAGGPERPNVPLVVMYPAESTLRLDHPFVVLSSASAGQRHAAEDFRRYLQQPEQQEDLASVGFRSQPDGDEDSPWVLDPAVAESIQGQVQVPAGALVDPPNAELVDAVLGAWRELRRPANVLLVLDTSSSMTHGPGGEDDTDGPPRLDTVQTALQDVVGQLVGTHDVGLWTFPSSDPDQPWVEQIPLAPLTPGREELREAIDGLTAGGATPLYRTVAAAYLSVAQHADDQVGADRINAVIVLSDGGNSEPGRPTLTLAELAQEIEAVDASRPGRPPVQVFPIGFSESADYDELEQIAQMARGEAFDATNPERLDEILPEVLDAL
jgi:Ca-activated chloride channel homolog